MANPKARLRVDASGKIYAADANFWEPFAGEAYAPDMTPIPANDDIALADLIDASRDPPLLQPAEPTWSARRADPPLDPRQVIWRPNDGPVPANDNHPMVSRDRARQIAMQFRDPLYEEWVAERLGDDGIENALNYSTAMRIEEVGERYLRSRHARYSPGGGHIPGVGFIDRVVRPATDLIGAERGHRSGSFDHLKDGLGERFDPVMAAIFLRKEMAHLAPPGTPKRHAAARGRQLVVDGLRRVGRYEMGRARG